MEEVITKHEAKNMVATDTINADGAEQVAEHVMKYLKPPTNLPYHLAFSRGCWEMEFPTIDEFPAELDAKVRDLGLQFEKGTKITENDAFGYSEEIRYYVRLSPRRAALGHPRWLLPTLLFVVLASYMAAMIFHSKA